MDLLYCLKESLCLKTPVADLHFLYDYTISKLHLNSHKSSHSFAISFLRNGANPFELQIALGHTTLEMTRSYTQALGLDDVFKRDVVASPVDNIKVY